MSVSLEKKNRKTYDQTKKKLMKHTIDLVNVIVTTLLNFEETALYFAFRFQLIIIDEITRVIESNV
jgi:superfamily II DNA or RNA helicase